jgi:hypothetical protein
MLCRVLFIGHPAKAFFAQCQIQRHPAKKCTRQNSLCRVPGTQQSPAFGKARPSAKVVDVMVASCRHPLPSAAPLGTRQSIFFIFLKKFLCQVPLTWHPANYLFIFCFFGPVFFCGAILQ